MTSASDARFAGTLPHQYERLLVPMLFDPYARDLALAGFSAASMETVVLQAWAAGARAVAEGFCQGTPLRAEIEARGGDVGAATDAAAHHLGRYFGSGPFHAALQALVISVPAA